LAFFTQLLSLFGIAQGINYLVWEWGVLTIFGILNAIYVGMSAYAYDQAFKELRTRKGKVVDPVKEATAKALQADIMREWNSYAIEDIISAFTLTPLVPYWYAAMGMCSSEDDEENHW